MQKTLFSIALFFSLFAQAQEFIPLWPTGKMPNTKGIRLTDSIANERIYRVGNPGMYAFFPSSQENRGAAVLICPGGGYERLAYITSGWQLAKWFNSIGVTAFVLNYRLPNSPDLVQRETGPLIDAQRAMKIIRANAVKWNFQPNKIGIQGTSAGGHLASLTAVTEKEIANIGDSLDKVSSRPNFAMLLSPVIDLGKYAHKGSRNNLLGTDTSKARIEQYSTYLQVTSTCPPVFMVHAYNDNAVPVKNSLLFYEALLDKQVPASIHIFPQGAHAIILHNNPGSVEQWTTLFEAWLREMTFLVEKR
ncbi:alpha/beta hydrolase [Pinibacter soli]|uniref:Alpha/beta hydrolase n=1 Tax=Pinibacter soli TaxID=3044211 RepID=A0ABT6RFV5_9BACT|nr:alpha/beta hydrolase [Pinibacter soli]MDI3321255.1 alpha/beta hydrolase [Pinibacter soli]